jgi:A/G-specific adenine glycosylase
MNITYKEKFAHDLCNWFRSNKRNLPFRMDKDPYRIFVSELMLQQTQIDTMIPYYTRFMHRFPTISDLANAGIDEVMSLWAGLGYYRRAKYLHESAILIEKEFNGTFPTSLKAIESLKGVGRYTAHAIHSIAYDEPSPAVDGNVMRVMARILGYAKDIRKTAHMREIEDVLKPVIVHEKPSDFTEALMEIGALVCKKANPKCEECPLSRHCFAYEHKKQDALPVSSKRAKKTTEVFITLVVRHAESVLLVKRPEGGLLAGLYGFVQYEGDSFYKALETLKKTYGFEVLDIQKLALYKHVFTHKLWHMETYVIDVATSASNTFYPLDSLPGVSTAHKKIIDDLKK